MNQSSNNPSASNNRGRRNPMRIALVSLVVILIGGTAFFFMQRQPRGPKLLNEPTKAREVRPFTTKPDSRFAPLPIEREKHGK